MFKKALLFCLSLMMVFASFGIAQAGSVIKLLEVRHDYSGVYIVFEVDGDFDKSDLKIPLHVVGGSDYTLECAQSEANKVTCRTSVKTGGEMVTFNFGGQLWSIDVPFAPPLFCTQVWDISGQWPSESDPEWVKLRDFCMKQPFVEGDRKVFVNPEYGPWYYVYFKDRSDCIAQNHFSAYYISYLPSLLVCPGEE